MTVHMKSIPVHAFHFIPADPIDLEEYGDEASVQRARIERELPHFKPLRIEVETDDKGKKVISLLFQSKRGDPFILVVWEEGWIAEDPLSIMGYEALLDVEFPKFLAGKAL